ncbi:hypothetical protein M0805_007282 [Coniferiporia weirii]|nr:hypothetical protein M0805_007282 [Coniferiporia weirii]
MLLDPSRVRSLSASPFLLWRRVMPSARTRVQAPRHLRVIPVAQTTSLRLPPPNRQPSGAVTPRARPRLDNRRSLSETLAGTTTPFHPSVRCYSSASSSLPPPADPPQEQSPEQAMVALKPACADGLPPLPHIQSKDVRLHVFTHRSVYGRSRHDFEDLPNDPAPDNEVLEHLGDAVLGLVVTSFIRECYPHLRVGPATKIRSLVVGNSTLAEISHKYELHQRLKMHHAHALTLQSSMNIRADVFEAYVGGVYADRGMDVVSNWIRALLLPYVKEAYRIVRDQYGLPPHEHAIPSPPLSVDARHTTPSPEPIKSNGHPAEAGETKPSAAGYLSLFNQHLQQKHKTVEWVYEAVRNEGTKVTPMWIAQAKVDGRSLADGRGNTKKIAQNEAARNGLAELGIVVA